MELTNYEALILQNEISTLLSDETNGKTSLLSKYKLTKLMEKATNELKPFEMIREQVIKQYTNEDGTMNVTAIESSLNDVVLEKININYNISMNDISEFKSDKVPQVLFKFVLED